MKINPSNITSPKQAKALNLARRTMSRVDEVVDAVKSLDQSEDDFNKSDGLIVVDKIQITENEGAFRSRRWTSGATFEERNGQTQFKGNAELAGSLGFMPIGLDAKISKTENAEQTSYKVKYEGSVSGPSTTSVKIDKSTGEIDVQQRWLGIIPARLGI